MEEERLENIWLTRGNAIKDHYPDSAQRRRIYKTSLSPRSASSLIQEMEALRTKFIEGAEYAAFTAEQKLQFAREILELLSAIPVFRIDSRLGRIQQFDDWPRLLRWWLAKSTLEAVPQPSEITSWYEFVSQNFIYRGSWGLGSVLGLLLDLGDGDQPVRAIEIDDWPRSGLPWIAFWLKELISWGTLDPVAAYLLARGNAIDRPQAEADALHYYAGLPVELSNNDRLDPRLIRDWVNQRRRPAPVSDRLASIEIPANLVRPGEVYLQDRLIVMPAEADGQIIWTDPAGYAVARSVRPAGWPQFPFDFLFELDVLGTRVEGKLYQPHA